MVFQLGIFSICKANSTQTRQISFKNKKSSRSDDRFARKLKISIEQCESEVVAVFEQLHLSRLAVELNKIKNFVAPKPLTVI
jgi:hypothetical protein